MERYLRFVVDKKDQDSGRNMGLFTAMRELRDDNKLYEYEETLVTQLLHWFDLYLVAPSVQASESRYYSTPMAISWFKSSAVVHIAKMREFGQILESHDVYVTELITHRPGKILYRDKYQIAAIPYKDTF